jgi:hypothetical protein
MGALIMSGDCVPGNHLASLELAMAAIFGCKIFEFGSQ